MPDLQTTIAWDGASRNSAVGETDYDLWDFAGVDGLQAAIALFTPAISHIAPFQSLTTNFNHQPCSVLRLCDNNFRVALSEKQAFDQAISTLNFNVWCKPCPAVTLVIPTDVGLAYLPKIATTKPRYTLDLFPCDRAVPARINGIAILVWHHSWYGQPKMDIQMARANFEVIRKAFSSFVNVETLS